MFDQLNKYLMASLIVFIAFMLMSCSSGIIRKEIDTQVQIRTSSVNMINSISYELNDAQFNALANKIAEETQRKLMSKGITSYTNDINGINAFVLSIDYDYLETDSVLHGRKRVYAMKGRFKLLEYKTNKLLFTGSFDEIEDRISDFANSVSEKIADKTAKCFY